MKTLTPIQGSNEWHQVRLQHFTASEAPAMMGASKYTSRDDLLKLKATGIAPEISEAQQRLFDRGHATEAAIRPYVESIIGEELYPVTGSREIENLKLLASFDGLTMMEDRGFEHKLWNQDLANRVNVGDLEPHYYWQLEQQLLVSGAGSILFVVSDGTPENCVYCEYTPQPGRKAQLIAGWIQFAIDLANYVVPEAEAAKAIAEPVETLPAITYSTEFNGKSIELRSNLEAYKAAAMRLVEQSKKQLATDQDFADAEARIKACKAAEEKIAVIQSNVIGEVADIDKFVKDLGAISEMLRQCRLNEDKQVKARKESIKIEALTRASNEWNAVIAEYNQKLKALANVQMPAILVDFQGAIKGLKTVASLNSKLNDEIARGKIEAARVYGNVTTNIQLLHMIAGEYMELFADIQSLCVRDTDYIKAIAKQRVDEHKAAEQARIQAEAKRIADAQIEVDRKAELAKLEAENRKHCESLPASAAVPAEDQTELFANDLPDDYEQYAAQTPAFNEAFDSVFGETPEPLADMGDYQKGVIAGLELAIKIFVKSGSVEFEKAVRDFIAVGVPVKLREAA